MSCFALTCDLGSTYTKVAVLEMGSGRLVAWAKAPSTVETDVTEGLRAALGEVEAQSGLRPEEIRLRLASSSAGGGLRLVAVGLVPELTGEAARRAALGAGARVERVFSYEMTGGDVAALEEIAPDIILLSGGTDGGDRRVILHNAARLADCACNAPVLVAGNRAAADEAARRLRRGGKDVRVTGNVLPSLDCLNVGPVRAAIRRLFMQQIVAARGLDRTRELIGRVMMPTPRAVLRAVQVRAGLGAVRFAAGGERPEVREATVALDVGGATTDAYSVGRGDPSSEAVVRGMPEPVSKRTVEGDLGVRYNAASLLAQLSSAEFSADLRAWAAGCDPPPREVEAYLARLGRRPDTLPRTAAERAADAALAGGAARLALRRHAGRLNTEYTAMGPVPVIRGKDLREFPVLIGTGGPIVSGAGAALLRAAIRRQEEPGILLPRGPRLWVDENYILFAAGLLAEQSPDVAARIMRVNLREVGEDVPC